MPNPISHMSLAKEASEKIASPILDNNLGAYLLGSTAPDSRIITKSRREDTHFSSLDSPSLRDGVDGLFKAHPGLAISSQLDDVTVAFILGYISHLVLDQAWITQVYRPFFGNKAIYQNLAESSVMDRALQLEMDIEVFPKVSPLRPVLKGSDNCINVSFISPETLSKWREWIESLFESGMSWDRLRFIAGRHIDADTTEVEKSVQGFLKAIDAGLSKIYEKVPVTTITAFKRRAMTEFVNIARGYLN